METIKLHLGCGPHILKGWHNYDLTPGAGGIHHDLRQPLPFDAGTVDFIFSEHVIEHLTADEGLAMLTDCYRILKPGGVIRISTPDLKSIMNDYRLKKLDRYAPTWTPTTPARFVNEAMRLWGHQFIYDIGELTSALRSVGFRNFTDPDWHKSAHPELRELEVRPYLNDLILEASK